VTIRDNHFSGGGTQPSGDFGKLVAQIVGAPLPDILFDGIVNKNKFVDGQLPEELRLSIANNGDASFANFNLEMITPANLLLGKVPVNRDLEAYAFVRSSLEPVILNAHQPPKPNSHTAVAIYRGAPKKLSEWALFQGNGSTQAPVDGVVPYDLNTPLFSDYTNKYRFIRIPPGTSIKYTSSGPLEFPEGTAIAKTFAYPIDMTDPAQGERLLETRIEFLRDGNWYGFSYLWNDEQTEAMLTLGGKEIKVSWIHRDGRNRTNRYEIPNANQCLDCHSRNKRYVPIGTTASNMNREFKFGEGSKNQLDSMAAKKLLVGLPKIDQRPVLPQYDNPDSGKLAPRARAWLHVNCAHCHNPEGTARTTGLDLRLTQADPSKLGFWKTPVAAGHGTGGREYDIVPGHPDKSILLYRMESLDPSVRMPNISRNLVPVEATAMIREWIAKMPKTN
ncbi:MAG: SO2930 family diheme c-type cytochrome, partial [Pirellulales bacterium]